MWQQEGPASDELNFDQPYRGTFIDCCSKLVMNKQGPHTKAPDLIYIVSEGKHLPLLL